MAESKIDTLIAELLNVRQALGKFNSDITTLYKRAEEDRKAVERRHNENQTAFGELREGTQKAISEMRSAIGELQRDLRQHADSVTALRAVRGSMPKLSPRIAFYATIGFGTLLLLGVMFDAAIRYGINWLLAKWL